MKKVSGYVSARPLGSYDFEFFVEDSITEEEIKRMVDNEIRFSMDYSMDYKVEEGYKRRMINDRRNI